MRYTECYRFSKSLVISRNDNKFSITNRLHVISMGWSPIRNLVAAALPIMRNVSSMSRQSCHLAVESGVEMVVIAGVEAPAFSGLLCALVIGSRFIAPRQAEFCSHSSL